MLISGIAIPSYGWIAFLWYDVRSSSCTRDIHCADGIILLSSGAGPIKAIPYADGAINILSKPTEKVGFINLANRLPLPSKGTVAEIKERLKHYSVSLKSRYNSEWHTT